MCRQGSKGRRAADRRVSPNTNYSATKGPNMFTLVRKLPLSELLARQVPALAVSFLLAELCFKFHSFTLECLAFLATWTALDALFHAVAGWWNQGARRR